MTIRSYVALAAAALLAAPTVSWAGKLTCLTGSDPSVANDLSEIAAVRANVDAACQCASFDGSKGKTHAQYVACASGVIGAQVSAGNLRTQCKATVRKYYSVSTCGVPASKGDAPCIKTSATGKVSCSIKTVSKCKTTSCPTFKTCIDAADTNGDGIIGIGDSGACGSSVAPTATPTQMATPVAGQPTNTPPPPPAGTPTQTNTPTMPPPTHSFVDNGDGTITDSSTGLMWEKKDQSGGLHNVNNPYVWAGRCSDGSGLCQPDAVAASTCSAATDGAEGCAQCAGMATCNTTGGSTTIWQWLNQLNAANFAGHSDWRIPTVGQDGGTAQLETILDASAPGCGSGLPCVPSAFNTDCTLGCNATGCSCTASDNYWSASTSAANPIDAWVVDVVFPGGFVSYYEDKGDNFSGRAVR